jgi:hypothetical protein
MTCKRVSNDTPKMFFGGVVANAFAAFSRFAVIKKV